MGSQVMAGTSSAAMSGGDWLVRDLRTPSRVSPKIRRRRLLYAVLASIAFLGGLSLGLREAPTGAELALSHASVAGIVGDVAPVEERMLAGSPELEAVSADVQTVRVLPGDTLWSIAGRTYPDVDPRAVVTAIREANGGQLRSLQVGTELIVPSRV